VERSGRRRRRRRRRMWWRRRPSWREVLVDMHVRIKGDTPRYSFHP
jgi:hypothetical protein